MAEFVHIEGIFVSLLKDVQEPLISSQNQFCLNSNDVDPAT